MEIADGVGSDQLGRAAGEHAVGGPFAEDELHDGFAPAGERDSGGEVVGIAAATDEGGVADAAWGFVEGSAGGSGGSEVAARIESDRTHRIVVLAGRAEAFGVALRAVLVLDEFGGWSSGIEGSGGVFVVAVAGEGGIGEAGGGTGPCLGESLTFAIEDEFAVIDQLHAVGLGEAFSAFADEVDMRALLEDETGGVNGIAEAFDAGDPAGFHASTIHEECIELDAAVRGEEAAATGVEGGIVFEDGDGGFDGVDGSASASEDLMTDFEGAAHAGFVGGGCVGGDGPGSAMNEEGGVVGGGQGHTSDIVVHAEDVGLSRRAGLRSAANS